MDDTMRQPTVYERQDLVIPFAPAPAPEPFMNGGIRPAAWNECGVPWLPGSPLAAFARERQLGAPLTEQHEERGYLWQGFALGIVVAPANEPARARVLPW